MPDAGDACCRSNGFGIGGEEGGVGKSGKSLMMLLLDVRGSGTGSEYEGITIATWRGLLLVLCCSPAGDSVDIGC